MKDFIARIYAERVQLQDKVDRLDAFLNGKNSETLKESQKPLLTIQLNVMKAYLDCLNARLKDLDSALSDKKCSED